MNIRLRYSIFVTSLLLGANIFAMEEGNANTSEYLSKEDFKELERVASGKRLALSSPQNSMENISLERRFFGKKPKGFNAFVYGLKNAANDRKLFALGISGGPKSGKNLLVESELMRKLSPCVVCSISGQDIVQAKDQEGTFDANVQALTGENRTVKMFDENNSKFLVYYIKRLDNALPKLTENEQSILLQNLDAMADPENLHDDKKIVIVTSSIQPILTNLYRLRSTNSSTLVTSVTIEPTNAKNRKAMWSGYFDTIAQDYKDGVDMQVLADDTQGFTGYDIRQVLERSLQKFDYKESKKQKNNSNSQTKSDLTSVIKEQIKKYMQEIDPQGYKKKYEENKSLFI